MSDNQKRARFEAWLDAEGYPSGWECVGREAMLRLWQASAAAERERCIAIAHGFDSVYNGISGKIIAGILSNPSQG